MNFGTMETEMLQFNKAKFNAFKKAFRFAIKHQNESFNFDGHEFLTDYAKQMIEFLEIKFKHKIT